MKNLYMGLGLIALFIITASFERHKDKLPNYAVLKTFQLEFKNAKDINWTEEQEVVTASFVLGHSRVLAFFCPDGMLMGTARSILMTDLPLPAFKEINSRFENSSFYDITEFTIDQDLYYVLIVETQTKKMEVKVLPSGESYIRKSKKIKRQPSPDLFTNSIQPSPYLP
jgi:hypothetical protein